MYCSVTDLQSILNTTKGKFRIGNASTDHMDSTTAESFIFMAEVEIKSEIRDLFDGGVVPTYDSVPDELRFATANKAIFDIVNSNMLQQVTPDNPEMGSVFNKNKDKLIKLFRKNYKAGVYGNTYSGVNTTPILDIPASQNSAIFPRYPLAVDEANQDNDFIAQVSYDDTTKP